MSLPLILAALAVLGVLAYALLAGADFGGGVWDLFASGPRAEQQRAAIARAMGPVWEANHVWLIFVIVVLFSAFPVVFATVSIALYFPFTIAVLGIVLRGSAFVFRAHAREATGVRVLWGRIFAIASVITPFVLGMCVGAVASGRIRTEDGRVITGFWQSWLGLFPLACGALALATCAYLASVYLMYEAHGQLRADFRRRALVAGGVFAACAAAALPLARQDAPRIWEGLTSLRAGWVLPLAFALAAVSLVAVVLHRPATARIAAAGEVTVIILGWAAAQYPYFVVPDLTVEASAASPPMLRAMLVVLSLGMAVLLPSLWLLFAVFKGKNPAAPPVADE